MKELPRINPNQPIAIDLETCDPELKVTAPGYITGVGFVAGFAIAAEEGAFYIPVGHTRGENYDMAEVIEWLNYTLSGDTDKVFHNAQYDLGWLKYVGVQLHGRIFDTMLAAALLNEDRKRYSLDSLGKEYMDEGKNEIALEASVKALFADTKVEKSVIRLKEPYCKCKDYQPLFDAKKRECMFYQLWPKEVQDKYIYCGKVTNSRGQYLYKVPTRTQDNIKALLWAVDPEEMGSYPIQDADLTYKLYKQFSSYLAEEKLDKVMALENELLPCLLEMREQGVKIDIDKAIELDKEYTEMLEAEQEKLNQIAGFAVNVDAAVDLVRICETLGLDYAKTEKGNPCFSSEVMPKHEAFDIVTHLRHIKKARDTYVRGYYFSSSINGRLHGQYNQLKSDEGGTVTGRLSSSNPNLQNIPARGELGEIMRTLFLPDTPKEKWLCMDFSGQEPKMLVNLVLLLDKHFGTRQVRNMVTGETEVEHQEGFPGANLARQPEFSSRKADFHTAVAKRCMIIENKVKGVTVTEEELAAQAKGFRSKAKSIGLGIMYGSGDAKVAEEMSKKGYPMSTEDAKRLRASVYEGVPFLDAVNKYVMDIAKRRGYVMTLLKRRGRFTIWECPVYGIPRGSYKPKAFHSSREAYSWMSSEEGRQFDTWCQQQGGSLGRPQRAFTYKALNKIIQGSSADQTKTAMLHLYKRNHMEVPALDIYYRRVDFEPPKFRTQVHDELNFSIQPDEDIHWYQDLMENSLPTLVENVAEPGIGDNWKEAK